MISQCTHMTSQISTRAIHVHVYCPVQVLVVDRCNGPADVLFDTIARMLQPAVCVTRVTDGTQARRALNRTEFSLIAVGVEDGGAVASQAAWLRSYRPALRAIAVTGPNMEPARQCAGMEMIRLPRRASELKALVLRLARELACR